MLFRSPNLRMVELLVSCRRGHDVPLHERCGYEYQYSLHKEGPRECEASVRVYAPRLREEEAADEEEDDGSQGLEPDVGLRDGLVRGAEGEDDGVT